MAESAQPKNEPEDSPLSPWWVRSVLIVLVFGLVALLAITLLASRNAPPIPGQVKDASGATVFTADDISNGQALFLGRSLRADEPRWLVPVINLLFAAFVVVIGASLLGEWARMSGLLGKWWFWFGDQSWGMLAIALMVFVLRQTTDDARWPVIEKYIRVGFWGTNIGLLMMVALSLFPGGVLQVWDVVQHGYWHARSLAYTGTHAARLIEWLRLPGDLVFIIFGAMPLVIAAIKAYIGVRATRESYDPKVSFKS